MTIWKLGCNWGKGAPNFYEFIKKERIVITHTNYIYKSNDLVVVTEGYNVRALTKVLEPLKPVTNRPDFKRTFEKYKIDYNDNVFYGAAEWYELKEEERFQYKLQKGIRPIQKRDVLDQVNNLWYSRNNNYWIFQGNPKVFDFKTALEENLLQEWTVSAHKDKIKIGDKVIIWISGKNAGCYGLAEVTQEPHEQDSSPDDHLWKEGNKDTFKAGIELTHNFWDDPILLEDIKTVNELSNLKVGIQGSNFTASKTEYDVILNLAEQSQTESVFIETLKAYNKEDLLDYFKTLDDLLTFLKINLADERLVFGCKREKRLSFIIGQRYCFDLRPITIKWGFISLLKIKNPDIYKSEPYKGKPTAYFSRCQFSKSVHEHLDEINEANLKELQRTEKSGYLKHGNPYFEKAAFDSRYRQEILNRIFSSINNKVNMPLNLIMYGPPGTGKTYHTINKAIEIIEPSFDLNQYREKIKDKFDELVEAGRIVFTTFHQSMSYEDFVEGIKPCKPLLEDKYLKYEIEPGTFKILCDKANSNFENSKTANQKNLPFEDAFEQLKEDWENNPEMKFPLKTEGYDFTIIGFTNTSIQFKKASGGTSHTLSINSLKEQYYGKDFNFKQGVGIYYPAILNKLKSYESHAPQEVKLKNYVIIIDEINRGNVSAIFGELITLIEKDKRLGNNEALEVKLPYSKEGFSVPPNLFIIGTMNTADRSVEALDTALRRRFHFEEMPPEPEVIKTHGRLKDENGILNIQDYEVDLAHLLKTINDRINILLDRDHLIGHSYFMEVDSLTALKKAFAKNIIPLLQEYFYGDYGKISLVLGEEFCKGEKVENNKFAATTTGYDADAFSDKIIYSIQNIASKEFDIVSAIQTLLNEKEAEPTNNG